MGVIDALAPAFAMGFAVQQLLELLDPIVVFEGTVKKIVLGLVALGVGVVVAGAVDGIRVLSALGTDSPEWIDVAATGLIVSAGTEGFNSILKFLGYAKEEKKEIAKEKGSAIAST